MSDNACDNMGTLTSSDTVVEFIQANTANRDCTTNVAINNNNVTSNNNSVTNNDNNVATNNNIEDNNSNNNNQVAGVGNQANTAAP